ncbi:SNARE associated Golgi protein-related protein [Desulfarculus baarsii DSM 2075]|uniref:SNARE associated Golgi protein-related protein n=1 Tax=Desulfarculus baarsii (strain ATCC 33931 / DSM 2075 / LMG 7858 / VKM B-1802 / 2st14) TaxID=644282 RepID=E1QLA9_DESB2|nr:DedA family protein [Desulfarculus baarsii]ADK85374.1 SNARE associated Golgi protein-related protein [Desulfarculus baarsii DSM 2075]
MDSHFIEQVVSSYGYLALFVGTFLEGETFFLLGGIAARKDLLNPFYVAMAAMAGGFVGDQFFFFLGRWRGDKVIGMSRRLERKAVEARVLVRRHAVALILMSRFLYGLRMVIPLACGAAHITPWRFVALNFISALLWTLTFGGLGYFFGGWLSDNIGAFKNMQVIVAVLAGVLLACLLAGRLIKKTLAASGDEQGSGR